MENVYLKISRASLCLFIALGVICGCGMYEDSGDGCGELRLSFNSECRTIMRDILDIPDTSDFHLIITDSKGRATYDGKYGDCPESLTLPSGSYSISVSSCDFVRPAFSSPQFGDEQCVLVDAGETVFVKLMCRQLNAGVKLYVDPDFLVEYPDGVLFLKSDRGRLMYGYSERRIAYFSPGSISLQLVCGEETESLMTRVLEAQEVAVISVNVSSGEGRGSGLSLDLDTSRVWSVHEVTLGEVRSGGESVSDALTVSQAISSGTGKDVWVSGYIVGGDLTSANASFEPPFQSRSNLLLGPRSSTVNRDACIAVQLPSGKLRDALNIVDNPDNLGRKICLRGDLTESYFGLVGLKNISDYE